MWKKFRLSVNPNNLSQGIVRLARCLFYGHIQPGSRIPFQ